MLRTGMWIDSQRRISDSRHSSNRYTAERSPRAAAARANCIPSVDFPTPLGPVMIVIVPRSRPPWVSSSSSGTPNGICSGSNGTANSSGSSRGKTSIPAIAQPQGMPSGAKIGAAELHYPDPPPAYPEFQLDDGIGDELKILVRRLVGFRREKHRRADLAQVAEKRQRLLAELERIGGEIPKLRQPVDEDPRRLLRRHFLADAPRDRLPLHLRRRENIVIVAVREKRGIGAEVQKRDPFRPKAEPFRIAAQFALAFAEGDEEARLAPCRRAR